jgi:hypothetical protein
MHWKGLAAVIRKDLLTFLIVLFAFSVTAKAQSERSSSFLNPDAPQNCEQNAVSMEELATMTLEQTKSGGVLIAIAHSGEGERSREFNHRRLYNVREFLQDRAVILADRVVVAEGERVRGLGRVEFFLSGKKIGTLLFARNKDLCVICCSDDGPYYPQKDNLDNKSKGRWKRVHVKGRQLRS